MKTQSPQIASLSWGNMTIEGVGTGKDFKLWPGGGREWDWGETNMHHSPGIQPADVTELLDNGCEVIVLSRGMLLRLKTREETIQLLREKAIEVHVAETKKATAIYNDLVSKRIAVGGLFHSTC